MRGTEINYAIVYFIRLRDHYSNRRYDNISELDNLVVPLKLLKIAVFLSFKTTNLKGLGEIDIDLQFLDRELLNRFVDYVDEDDKENVRIIGYNTNIGEEIDFGYCSYMKNLFCYLILPTYDNNKNSILWMGLLFPFLNKMNAFCFNSKDVFDRLQASYPLQEDMFAWQECRYGDIKRDAFEKYSQVMHEVEMELGIRQRRDSIRPEALDGISIICKREGNN